MKTRISHLLIALTIGLISTVAGQPKRSIDLQAIDQWTCIDRPVISPDGKFAAYITENRPAGYQTFTLCATEGDWKKEVVSKDFHYSDEIKFTKDSRYCLFRADDTLHIVSLGSTKSTTIPGVDNVELLKGTVPVIIYTTKKKTGEKVLLNMATNKVSGRINCDRYTVSPGGRYLAYSMDDTSGVNGVAVYWYDLENFSGRVIWQGKAAGNFIFDRSGNRLAFTGSGAAQGGKDLLLYQSGETAAKIVAQPKDLPLKGDFLISSLKGFTRDGTMLYFTATEQQQPEMPSPTKAKVDVWGFNDPMLQSQQRKPVNGFFMVSHLANKKIYRLGRSQDLFFDPAQVHFPDKLLLSKTNNGGDGNEGYWNKTGLNTISVVSAITGEVKVIDTDLDNRQAASYLLSPDGTFILYYDAQSNNYYSYNIQTGNRINLTKNIQAEWDYSIYKVQASQGFVLRGLAGWVAHTNEVLLQSRYDIWRVSLDGSRPPVCITKGYGKAHHIELVVPSSPGDNNKRTIFKDGKQIYVSAFDLATKDNGFFTVDLAGRTEPAKITMGEYCYFVSRTEHSWGDLVPLKAEDADAWLVGRQRSDASVNYFFTKDFKEFRPITHNYPEKNYNWLSAELLSWKLPDNSISQGILYKPENFDPTKKYPVIFLYYEELSDNLHVYMKPERATGEINIPYYVSNGYLVFTPDIKRTKSGAGQDALNTMESAAKYLSALPYVDPARLGLCGLSMGGYKTDYIITHSPLFAAANANADISDVASAALDIWPIDGASLYSQVEVYQFYLGYSIAERPDLYVKASPVFYIDKVQTPLLIQHNKEDSGSPWAQGLAMFNALRREGKPVWMLQYDGQGHFLDDRDTVVTTDFTIRQKQFFDHYLMGKPAPVWMTRGIPAWKKGIDDGLALDTTIQTPVERLLTPAEKARHTKKHIPVAVSL